MATLQEVESAFLRAHQAGDTQAASVLAGEVKRLRAAAEAPPGEKWTAGGAVAVGLADPIHGGAQLLTNMLPKPVVDAGNKVNNWLADKTGLVARLPEGGVDESVKQREAGYTASRTAAGKSGVDWWRMLGNAASPVNIGISAALPGAGATLAQRMVDGARIGAISGALQPATSTDFMREKGAQMLAGAAGGAVAPAVVAGAGRIISPKASVNPELAMLKAEGVQPTIGQTLGGRWNTLEEKATSLPIVGDAISSARKRSVEQFNRAAINRAVAPVGGQIDDVGQVGVAKAGDVLSGAYDAGKNAIGFFTLDRQGAQELGTLRAMASQLPDKERRAFDSVWSYLQGEISPNGSITAEGFKRIDSKIGKEAARFSGANDAYQQQAGDALKELGRVISENAKRANPQAAEILAKADKGWANLVRLEEAAKRAKNTDGIFTPGQLNMAIQTADKSVRKRAVARGGALMQDLAGAGQNVIGNKVPNSFTTDRALIAGGGLGAYFIDPLIPLGLGAGAVSYTPLAQALLRGAVSARPAAAQSVAGLLNNAAPMLAPTSGLLGIELVK